MGKKFQIMTIFRKHYIFLVSVGFVTGIIASYYFMDLAIYIVILLPLAIFILVICRNKKIINYVSIVLFIGSYWVGFGRFFIYSSIIEDHRSILRYSGNEVFISAVISSEIEYTSSGKRFVGSDIRVLREGKKSEVSSQEGRVLVYVGKFVEIAYGDTVVIKGFLEEPFENNEFSYKDYLEARGISSVVYAHDILAVKKRQKDSLVTFIKKEKKVISSRIAQVLPEPHTSLLTGIVYGERTFMEESFQKQLSSTGTTHIIAVSGYNVSVLIASIGILSSYIGKRVISLFTIGFIIFFMFFVGVENIPVVRACIMGIVFMLCQTIGRKRAHISVIPLTIALLLFWNPLSFTLISFQLSFCSLVGILIASKPFMKVFSFIPEFFREDVASTFAAITFTAPITLVNFGTFSPIAPLTNLLILPVIPVLTVYGLVMILLSYVSYPLLVLSSLFCWFALQYVIFVIQLSSKIPFALFIVSERESRLIILLLIIIIYLVIRGSRSFERHGD